MAALIAANVVWATAYALSKVLMDGTWAHISPLALSFWRLLAASLILLPLAWRQRPRRPLTGREWASLGAIGIVGSAAAMLLQFAGTQLSLATNAAVITSTETMFNCLLAALFLGERLDRRTLVGVLVALAGVLLLSHLDWRRLDLLSNRYAVGNGLLILAMLCYASYAIVGKFAVETLPPMVVTGYPFAIATLVLGLICARWDPAGLTGITAWSGLAWCGVGYLGVFVTALTYLLWNAVLVDSQVTTMSVTLYVQPVVGALIGWLWLGERLSPSVALGAALVLVAMALVTIRPRRAGTVREEEDGAASLSASR